MMCAFVEADVCNSTSRFFPFIVYFNFQRATDLTALVNLNKDWFAARYAGILLSVFLGIAAMAIALRYGAPVMLFAVLIGLALRPAYDSTAIQPGVDWCARPVLLAGVALLGFRVDVGMLAEAGWMVPMVAFACLLLTILAGALLAKAMGMSSPFGVLVGGSVAICGVSAAVAISSALPKSGTTDRELALTVAGVTAMSTLAMITYPLISQAFGHSDIQAGIFIGASIHDVAQVVGAGYSISEHAGDTATFVKLIRVSGLLPVVIAIGLIYGASKNRSEAKTATASVFSLFPPFLIAYIIISGINSAHILPKYITDFGIDCSRYFLIISLVAIGLKTNLKDVASVGRQPLIALILTTIFMAAIALLAIELLF